MNSVASSMRTTALCVSCVSALFVPAVARAPQEPATAAQPGPQPSRPPDQFRTVNHVRLHYLDWGGQGDVLLFLAGLGDDVHRFDKLAPRFTDRYHALGFTRRGSEPSEKPPTGYDLRTLAADIRGFMDAKGVRRATLVGHSIAGAEMTTFAALYPTRLTALVYLDAAYDYARAYELAAAGGLAKPHPEPTVEAVSRSARVHPEYARVSVPALAFFVLYDAAYVTPQMGDRARGTSELAFRVLDASGYKREQIDLFRKTVTHGRVIEWHDTNHMFFDDPKHSDETVRIIRDFLSHLSR
jgi:pimeloyl-ACP methyl ester carboxylesterase